jgi:hypothetical protein
MTKLDFNFTRSIFLAGTVLLLALSCNLAAAQRTIDDTSKGLDVIASFADRMCKQFSLEGKSNTRISSVTAQMEVRGILRTLVGAKLVAGVRAENEDYIGLLQRDLLQAMGQSNSCKEKYFNVLIERILPSHPIILSEESTTQGTRKIYLTPDGRRCVETHDVSKSSKDCRKE